MKQDIRFRGLTLNRDEQSADFGELALCGGVEVHDGALRPLLLEGTNIAGGAPIVTPSGDRSRLIYVHQTASYTFYISTYLSSIFYSEEYGSDVSLTGWKRTLQITAASFDAATVKSVNAIGNTLVILNADGFHYFLCKNGGTGWAYKYLGQQPPFLELQFGLANVTDDDENKERYEMSLESGQGILAEDEGGGHWRYMTSDGIFLNKEVSASMTEQVMARVNKRRAKLREKGYFHEPFLVRYCYRLYDGTSLVMHSPPVLMLPTLSHSVRTAIYDFYEQVPGETNWGGKNLAGTIKFSVFIVAAKLQCHRISSDAVVDELKEWGDIVKSVDIFLSPQLSRIDTSKKIEYADYQTVKREYSVVDGISFDVDGLFNDTYPNAADQVGFKIPEYDDTQFFSRIRSCAEFFKALSVSTDSISSFTPSLRDLSVDDSVVENITVQQQMTDDYKTHNQLLPATGNAGMCVYNHRLNVYGIGERLFAGFSPYVLFPWTSAGLNSKQVRTVTVYLLTDHGRRKVSLSGEWYVLDWLVTTNRGYCFYPDSRADTIEFECTDETVRRTLDSDIPLNGAVSFMNEGMVTANPTGDADDFVPMPNKVYTSRADNPFYFPNLPGESGINSVGIGEILGLSVATRALSQGQVGTHDLIAFCTDGIWVMKVSSTGTYSNLHNISREVCVNTGSICQLDQSVIFASGSALNRFVESDVLPLSEVLDGPFFDAVARLPGLAAEFSAGSDARRLMDFSTPPVEYFRKGRVLYDPTGYRLIVLPESVSGSFVALVFSIRDQAWATMVVGGLKSALNGYPSPYLQYAAGNIVRLDKPYDFTDPDVREGIVITRTLTFSDTMDVLRGFRQYCDCDEMPTLWFYGSDDQMSWQRIGVSARAFHNYMPGRPFRFFRIAVSLSMKAGEKYQSLALEIVNKYAKL